MNDADRKNIDLYLSYKLLFLTTPVLYGLIITKIFDLYHFTFTTQLILFFLPFIVGLFVKLKTKDIPNNTQNILQTMSFYSIPFFLAVNVCFDFSKPSSKGYLIIDKTSSVEEKYDSEGSYETTIYEFKAIPKEKMNPITFWMDISATKHSGLHPKAEILTHKVFLTIENKNMKFLQAELAFSKK